jgi:hypothetical protein
VVTWPSEAGLEPQLKTSSSFNVISPNFRKVYLKSDSLIGLSLVLFFVISAVVMKGSLWLFETNGEALTLFGEA